MNRRAFVRSAGLAIAAAAAGVPVETVAQGATPAAQPGSGGIASMLAMAPDSYPWVDDPANMTIRYADISTQLAVSGAEPIDSTDDPNMAQWIAATHMLAVPSHAAEYLNFWREDYGFDLFQAEETLEVSLPPFNLSLYRGRFDLELVRATLVENGYQEVELDGYSLLSLREDYEQDVTSPFAYKLAAMNHVALMDDGTIAGSSVQAALVAVLDVAAGQAPSLMEQAGLAMIAEHVPADVVSATLANGTVLAGNIPPELIDLEPGATPDIGAIATQASEASEMPPVAMVLVGVTAGGVVPGDNGELSPDTPGARAVAVALMLTPEAAEAAVPVVEDRLETGASAQSGQPWSHYFSASTVTAVDGAPVLVIDITVSENVTPMILVQMLNNRDLGILAW